MTRTVSYNISSDLVGNFAAEVQQAQGIDSFHPSEKPKMAGTPASSPRRKTTPGGPWVFDGFLVFGHPNLSQSIPKVVTCSGRVRSLGGTILAKSGLLQMPPARIIANLGKNRQKLGQIFTKLPKSHTFLSNFQR